MRRYLAIPAVALSAVLLTGCFPGRTDGGLVGTGPESPAAAPTPSVTSYAGAPTPTPVEPAPTSTPSAAPTAETAVAPECADIASLESLQANFHDELDGPDEYEFSGAGLPGPAAQQAAGESETLRACAWGIPGSDGVFTVSVHTIAPDVQDPLVTALASSSKYTAREDGYLGPDGAPATTFSYLFEEGIGYGLAYAFYDGYWVISSGTMISPDDAVTLTQKALAATVGANS